MRLRRVIGLAVLGAIGAGLSGAAGAGTTPAAAADRPPVRTVWIVSLPTTPWIDIRDGHLTHLPRLLRESALADLSTRTVRNRTLAGAAYVAFGAGARSVAGVDSAAPNLMATEEYAGLPASDAFRVRTGVRLGHGIGAIGWPQIVAQNEGRSYGEIPGLLGQTLVDADVRRVVVANADEVAVDGTRLAHREAALALVDRTGRVPGETRVTRADPTAPFGIATDLDRVDATLERVGAGRHVVLVEASDLARADRFRPEATPDQRALQHRQALGEADALVGRVLAHVDPARDAVMVVSPYHATRARTLGMLAVRAPGIAPGLMETGTTRRAGFVQIVDLAPTVLDLLGIERPTAMEGRAARYHAGDASYSERVDALVRFDRGAQFRDATIGTATAVLVVATFVLAIAALVWYRIHRPRWGGRVLQWAALLMLGYVPATFLAGLFPLFRAGAGAYFAVVAALALAFAVVCTVAGGRRPADPVMVGLALIVALFAGDLVLGARLELNTVFGYTATVGIRIAGIGNPGSAQLCAAALLLAVLLTWRFGAPGRRAGLVVLVATLVIVGAPVWGQDYGGALSLAPAVLVWWLLERGRRIRVGAVLGAAAALLAVGLVAGLVDLSRPEGERTHVGRLFERIGDDGPGALLSTVGRKASLMVDTFGNTAWVLLVAAVLVLLWLAARRTHLVHQLIGRVPPLRNGLVAFATLTALATFLNDSGVQVTGMMLATLLPVLVSLTVRTLDGPAAPTGATPETEPVPA